MGVMLIFFTYLSVAIKKQAKNKQDLVNIHKKTEKLAHYEEFLHIHPDSCFWGCVNHILIFVFSFARAGGL